MTQPNEDRSVPPLTLGQACLETPGTKGYWGASARTRQLAHALNAALRQGRDTSGVVQEIGDELFTESAPTPDEWDWDDDAYERSQLEDAQDRFEADMDDYAHASPERAAEMLAEVDARNALNADIIARAQPAGCPITDGVVSPTVVDAPAVEQRPGKPRAADAVERAHQAVTGLRAAATTDRAEPVAHAQATSHTAEVLGDE